ncbi:hypothetical protein MRX96_026895 [Rhipicephalus microplus]
MTACFAISAGGGAAFCFVRVPSVAAQQYPALHAFMRESRQRGFCASTPSRPPIDPKITMPASHDDCACVPPEKQLCAPATPSANEAARSFGRGRSETGDGL